MKKELSKLKHIQKEIEIIQEEIGKTTPVKPQKRRWR